MVNKPLLIVCGDSRQLIASDSHTLETVISDMEALVGNTIERILADKGSRGHNAAAGLQVQSLYLWPKARVTPKIKFELRRISAIEPVIRHLKAERRMGPNLLLRQILAPLFLSLRS